MNIIVQILVSFISLIFFSILIAGLHHIHEGYVGIYFRGGALLNSITYPGLNVKFPFITSVEEVQITVQTDKVQNIACGTSGGVMIYFDSIEVVNRLREEFVYETIKNYTINYDKTWIFDKIHHEINQFCSKHTLQEVYISKFEFLDEMLAQALQNDCNKWAPGIEIISIRVTKPKIPKNILQNYENIELQRTQYLIQEQEQLVKQKQAETKRLENKIVAETEADVNGIRMNKKIYQQESNQKIENIENQIYFDSEKAKADAYHYKIQKMIEAEQKQLTPQYLKKLAIESFTNQTTIYIGKNIPQFLFQNQDLIGQKS